MFDTFAVYFRLVLLLQAMAKYLEHILTAGTRKATAVQTSSNASIGLVVKKYWNKMVQIYSVVQKLQAEVGSTLNHILHISETSDPTRLRQGIPNVSLPYSAY